MIDRRKQDEEVQGKLDHTDREKNGGLKGEK